MSQLLATNSRLLFCRLARSGVARQPFRATSSTFQQEAAKFVAKHAQRASPMSPWMMYQPQLTWLLSISHRVSGLGLGLLLYGYGIAELVAPKSNFEQILGTVKETLPGFLLATVKLLAGKGRRQSSHGTTLTAIFFQELDSPSTQ